MIKDKFVLVGTPTFKLYDINGNLKYEFTKNNMIVNSGKTWILTRLSGSTTGVMSHIGLGSGNNAVAATNTNLSAELVRRSVDALGGVVRETSLVFTATFGPSVGTGLISEAGIFNAGSGGTMFSRVGFPPFSKAADDTLTVEWVVTQG